MRRASWLRKARRGAGQLVFLAALAMLLGLVFDREQSLGAKFGYGATLCGVSLVMVFVVQPATDWWHRRYPPIDRDPNELHAPPNQDATWPVTRL